MFKRSITSSLRKVDQFGAIFKPSIHIDSNEHKSPIGGLFSILLYGISLSYVIYEMIIWQRGDVLPKVTTLQKSYDFFTYNAKQPVSFAIRKHKNQDTIDPFNPGDLILQPIMYKVIDGDLQEPQPLTTFIAEKQYETTQIQIPNLELTLNESDLSTTPSVEYMIAFQKCEIQYLLQQESCASPAKIEEFFAQNLNQLVIKSQLEQYNTSTKQLEIFTYEYFAAFDENTTYFSQIQVATAEVQVDNGFILESWEYMKYTKNLEHLSQQMDLRYFGKEFKKEIYLLFQFEVANVQSIIIVEYPKISEILANVGAMVSFFLLFSQLAFLINEKTMEKDAQRGVIEMFFPQLKNVNFIENIFGNITEVRYENKTMDSTKFTHKYSQLLDIAKEKLCLSNIIYEISRIQFILQSLISTEQFIQSHTIGIKLSELSIEEQSKQEILETIQNDQTQQQIIPANIFEASQEDQIDKVQLKHIQISDINTNTNNNNNNNNSQSDLVNKPNDTKSQIKIKKDDYIIVKQQLVRRQIQQKNEPKKLQQQEKQEKLPKQEKQAKLLDFEDFGLLLRSNQDKDNIEIILDPENSSSYYTINKIN